MKQKTWLEPDAATAAARSSQVFFNCTFAAVRFALPDFSCTDDFFSRKPMVMERSFIRCGQRLVVSIGPLLQLLFLLRPSTKRATIRTSFFLSFLALITASCHYTHARTYLSGRPWKSWTTSRRRAYRSHLVAVAVVLYTPHCWLVGQARPRLPIE